MCEDLQLKWGPKQSYSPLWDLFNDMWHVTYTQGNHGDSWILVVRSQIDNLIPNPSFGHNLCFKCPNGSCEPILDIWRNFQSNEFWPLHLPFEDSKVHQDFTFQNGSSFGSVGVHSLTFSYTPRSMKCDSQASFLAHTFASPCFGHEPKVRVVTMVMSSYFNTQWFCLGKKQVDLFDRGEYMFPKEHLEIHIEYKGVFLGEVIPNLALGSLRT